MLFTRKILFLFSWLLFGLLFSSCSGDEKIVSISKQDNVEDETLLQPQELRDPQTITNPVGSPPASIIVFKGYLSSSEQRLYTISSRAERGTPQLLGKNHTQFIEMVSSPHPHFLYTFTEERGVRTLGEFNSKTNFFRPLIFNVGKAFDLKPLGPLKIAFLKQETVNHQSLNVFFIENNELKKQDFKNSEVTSYEFSEKQNIFIYAEAQENKSSLVKMNIEKENFGNSTILLEKEGVRFPYTAMNATAEELYFVEKKDALSKLKILDLKTGEETLLFEMENIYELSLSPNNLFLTFWTESYQGQELWLYNVLSKNRTLLSPLSVPHIHEVAYRHKRVHPVWTQDSENIIFGSFNRWYGNIYNYNLSTGKTRPLTDNIFVDFYNPAILLSEDGL
ncbi:MAG: hypothetical protein HYW47_00120 [Deltaproteobacteria bacterium]|nr:hypothetical protein [Deltaproteobacteria bacterium]